MRHLLLLVILLLSNFGSTLHASESPADPLPGLLRQIDELLTQRPVYMGHREHRIASIRNILNRSHFTPVQRYVLNQQLIDEYTAYQADSAVYYLYKNLALGQQLGDRRKIDETRISLGYLYGSMGAYLEAHRMLDAVDTARLDRQRLTNYYIARHKLHNELKLYSHDTKQKEAAGYLTSTYIGLIIGITEPGSIEHLSFQLEEALIRDDYGTAEHYATLLTDMAPPLSREYAIGAFMRSVVAQLKGDIVAQTEWAARAAMVDIQLAICDNAALNNLSNLLVHTDILRAMHYMRVVLDDARFFNSRLRPWQDVRVITMIEKAYTEYTQKTDARMRGFMLMLTAFALLAVIGTLYVVRQNRRLSAARTQLEQAVAHQHHSNNELKRFNERLLELNNQIREANTVKEEYIGIFLMMCSEYIDKISETRRHVRRQLRDGKIDELRKEYTPTESADERELKEFYTMFDTTFLRLYPSFIEEFNALLDEETHAEPRKGELLSTELRIFALIRLGITDSSKIAALLRYSVSTIYNYRSRIKCSSAISRDEFEQRLRTIGSLNV